VKVIWSPLAVEQTRDIAFYIAQDKPSVAKQWAEDIFASVDQLTDFPKSGRIVPEIKKDTIREIVQGNYRIIYKIHQTQISILLVKSYRQKLSRDEITS
jgi:plasmid stabilization system protein ParE